MRKRTVFIFFFVGLLVFSQLLSLSEKVEASSLSFAFNGSITRTVFQNFLSRAVTHEGLCTIGRKENLIFEEDLRMLRRTGTKFVAAACMYGDSPLDSSQLEEHFKLAASFAAKVHQKDREMLLEAYLPDQFEKTAVDSIKVPAYVFSAFNKTFQDRNFDFDSMLAPSGSSYNTGNQSGLFIGKEETRMFLYYMICRYIDAGYESVYLGDGVALLNGSTSNAPYLQTLLKTCRSYAKSKAYRELVFFDCKTSAAIPQIKVGDDLVTDFVTIPLTAAETKVTGNVFQAAISVDSAYQSGGQHPLGFHVSSSYVFLRFENYSYSGIEGKNNSTAAGCWGFNEITWFALQTSDYRVQFLNESIAYLKTKLLDSEGNQTFFLQLPGKIKLSEPKADGYFQIVIKYNPTSATVFNLAFYNAFKEEDDLSVDESSLPFNILIRKYYRCNRNGDGCPSGFGEENFIRKTFLGINEPESEELNEVIIPSKYLDQGSTVSINEYVASASSSARSAAKKSSSSKTSSIKNSTSSGSKSGSSCNTNKDETTSNSEITRSDFANNNSVYNAQSHLVVEPQKHPAILVLFAIFLVLGISSAIYFILRK